VHAADAEVGAGVADEEVDDDDEAAAATEEEEEEEDDCEAESTPIKSGTIMSKRPGCQNNKI